MNPTEINRKCAEEVGLCWHNFIDNGVDGLACTICGEFTDGYDSKFFDPFHNIADAEKLLLFAIMEGCEISIDYSAKMGKWLVEIEANEHGEWCFYRGESYELSAVICKAFLAWRGGEV